MKNLITILTVMLLFSSCGQEKTANTWPPTGTTPPVTLPYSQGMYGNAAGNPLQELTIRLDERPASNLGSWVTIRNSKGVLIRSYENQVSALELQRMYAAHIPSGARLLAIHNKADETIFEVVENGVKILKRVKLRGGGKIAALTGALLATYELLGGDNEIRKYSHRKKNPFHFQ